MRLPQSVVVLSILALAPALAGCASPEESIATSAITALPAADLAVTALTLPAEGGEVGLPMTVVATVSNEGALAGSATVRLFAGSVRAAVADVTVPAHGSEAVELTFTPARGGDVVLEAALEGAPGARAEAAIRAPDVGGLRWRHAPDGCTGNVLVETWFTNLGDAVARDVRVTVSIVDAAGRTWDVESVDVGDVAAGEEGHGAVTVTAYDRCNRADSYRFDLRVRPANGETATLSTETVDL